VAYGGERPTSRAAGSWLAVRRPAHEPKAFGRSPGHRPVFRTGSRETGARSDA